MVLFVPLRSFSALLSGTVNGKERGWPSTSGNKRRREEEDTEDAGMSLLSVHACVSMQADRACMCEHASRLYMHMCEHASRLCMHMCEHASRPVCIAGRTVSANHQHALATHNGHARLSRMPSVS